MISDLALAHDELASAIDGSREAPRVTQPIQNRLQEAETAYRKLYAAARQERYLRWDRQFPGWREMPGPKLGERVGAEWMISYIVTP